MVEPLRDQLDAVVVFPSMPEVMRLNKVGSFTMQNLGQSKSVVSDFMKKKKKVCTALCCRVRNCPLACRNRASLSSSYTCSTFKCCRCLVLWRGRRPSKRRVFGADRLLEGFSAEC